MIVADTLGFEYRHRVDMNADLDEAFWFLGLLGERKMSVRPQRLAILGIAMTAAIFGNIAVGQLTLEQQIDRQVQPYLQNDVAVGFTVGILQKGDPKIFGFGTVDKSQTRVPDGKTVYEIGSVSKVFTSLLLADAVERTCVKLDQSITELFPTGVPQPKFFDKPITLQHLATHSSGLPSMPTNLAVTNFNNPYADYTTKQMYEFLGEFHPARDPGTADEYSNLGFGLLGQLIADESKTSYEELLSERITKPLKMLDTSVKLSSDQQSRLAKPHDAQGTQVENWDLPALVGAGGIRSTMDDMLKFAAANLEPPEGELGQAIELAWGIHQKPLAKDDFAMGLGWHFARDGITHFHNGQTGGYHSMLFLNRKLKLAVIILSNSATMELDRLAEDLFKVVAGAKVNPREFEKTVKVPVEVMQRYVGKYQIIPEFVLSVSVVDDKLMIGATGQPTFQVYPRSETKWFYKVVEATITFKLNDSGECTELDLFQNGIHQPAKRVK